MHGEDWIVEIGPVQEHPRPSTLVLAVGAGDRDRFQVLAEKCTELGVAGLVPVLTERARQVATRVRPDGLDRARRRAREACKQSGNPWATQVDDLRELEALVDRFPGLRWYVGDAGGERRPSGLAAGQVGCLIGPEGGLTADEAQWARTKLGATPWCLGAFTLRFDTAAMAAASLVRYAGTS